jgi:hypothetical protein
VLLVRERRQDGERVSYFGGLNLVRSRSGADCDPPAYFAISRPAELVDRLLAGQCEMCGLEGPCMVYQVRRLADLRRSMTADPPRWVRLMVGRNRKTPVLCRRCYQDIKHTPRLPELSQHWKAGCDESRMSGLEEDCGKSARLGE